MSRSKLQTALSVAAIAALGCAVVGLTIAAAPSDPEARPVAAPRVEQCVKREATPLCGGRGKVLVLPDGERLRARWVGSFGRRVGWSSVQARRGGVRALRRFAGRRAVTAVRVRPGDIPTRSGERAELVASASHTAGMEGKESWYAWATYFPRRFHYVRASTWNIFAQWHGTQPNDCSPNVLMQINAHKTPPRLRLATRGGKLDSRTCERAHERSWDFTPLRQGRWHNFILRIRWSGSPERGLVELSLNGRNVVPPTRTATLHPGQGTYMKQGFYRAPLDATSRIYHREMTRFSRR